MDRELKISLVGNVDSGKCLGYNTPIMLYNGKFEMVQNIKIKDKLMGDDSTPRIVLATNKAIDNLYRIKQINGDDYISNGEHILSLKMSYCQSGNLNRYINGKKYQKGDTVDISVNDFIKLPTNNKQCLKGYKTPVFFPEKQVPIDPYIIGLWLGDGISEGTGFTNQEYLINGSGKENGDHFTNILNLLNNKHIPDIYKYNSRKNQLKLLAGILDSYAKGSYDIVQKNYILAKDIEYIARCLGFSSVVKECKKSCMYKGEAVYYRQYIYGNGIDEIPCLISRKKIESKKQYYNNLYTGITIEPVEQSYYNQGPEYCYRYSIQIDGNKRFILGDHTVTHNSSIVGVLTRGVLDDGNGLARSYVLKHNHERLRGQTSSIGTEIIGFDVNGKHITPANPSRNTKDKRLKEYKEVSIKSHTKIVLIDLCGHQKYLKTTLNGLCGYTPDYSMVIVAANSGTIPTMTLEHMNTCYALRIPFFIVLTKIDMAPENIYTETMKRIEEFIVRYKKRNGLIYPDVPVFKVSNKTGEGIEELMEYIRSLSEKLEPLIVDDSEKTDFVIENTYQVPGVGIVVGGFLTSGTIKEGQELLLGPNKLGSFDRIQVRSIYRQCVPTKEIFKNQQSTIAIKFIDIKKKTDKHVIRKGSRIMEAPEGLTDEFDATVKILRHSTGIREGYESVIHMENITQITRVVKLYEDTIEPKLEIDGVINNVLRMGSIGKVRLRFIQNKECIKIGTLFIFREGNCRGVGSVVGL